MEQEAIFRSFAGLRFPWCWKELVQWELAGSWESSGSKFVSLATLLHGKRCSQFSYTDFLQRCLERDPNEEDNTVEVPLTSACPSLAIIYMWRKLKYCASRIFWKQNIQGRSQTWYTTPCNDVISYVPQLGSIWVFGWPQMQKIASAYHAAIQCMFIFKFRL